MRLVVLCDWYMGDKARLARVWRPTGAVRLLAVGIALLAGLTLLNWGIASFLIWHRYDGLRALLARGSWPMEQGVTELQLKNEASGKEYRLSLGRRSHEFTLELEAPGQKAVRVWSANDSIHVASLTGKGHFSAPRIDGDEVRSALMDVAKNIPQPSFPDRVLASVMLRPFLTGAKWEDGRLSLKVGTSLGVLWFGGGALPLEGELHVGDWHGRIQQGKVPESSTPILSVEEPVPAVELSTSLAEAVSILAYPLLPGTQKPDEVRTSGSGWLVVKGGHCQMSLSGSPYEIGFQHGNLDPKGVGEVSRRLVYGVGLMYSLDRGEWFPAAARKLIERQRPFIKQAYFEEMEGLATGAGLPLDLIQMANIFPEFFHCSGVALMGDATVGGELLHARVLDYMVGVGLQDHAAVMAIAKNGVNRFVTVGYVGFIGSVTGMNEKQVAIGEMGGGGQGDWDGIPMSLLIRQSLEDCDDLKGVETLMRESPRTCEYYYLISDGKGPSALGVAATAKSFEVFGPGVWHERLTQPIKDAVLISGPGRYEKLADRVRAGLGKISRDDLIEIIKRPVAMKSNLHNVIFQPQTLRISVADAAHNDAACNQPYRSYTWNDLFSASPPR